MTGLTCSLSTSSTIRHHQLLLPLFLLLLLLQAAAVHSDGRPRPPSHHHYHHYRHQQPQQPPPHHYPNSLPHPRYPHHPPRHQPPSVVRFRGRHFPSLPSLPPPPPPLAPAVVAAASAVNTVLQSTSADVAGGSGATAPARIEIVGDTGRPTAASSTTECGGPGTNNTAAATVVVVVEGQGHLDKGQWQVMPPYPSPSAGAGATTSTIVSGTHKLKVLNLNLWGLGWPLAEDKGVRIRAVREDLLKGEYDIVLLQELWYRADYDLLRSTMPYVTEYNSMNSGCSSFLIPWGCSGLTVLSKYPITDVSLVPFSRTGSFWRFDGEIFVHKGVGIARIEFHDKTIDVFTTHLVAYTNKKADNNREVRYIQAVELVRLINLSDADIRIFGGDINATPVDDITQPYGMLRTVLKDSLLERFPSASLHPVFATFGNSENTYTHMHGPERIDYLMYRSVPSIKMTVLDFTMPILMTRGEDGRIISVSDHEALSVTFLIQDNRNVSVPRSLFNSSKSSRSNRIANSGRVISSSSRAISSSGSSGRVISSGNSPRIHSHRGKRIPSSGINYSSSSGRRITDSWENPPRSRTGPRSFW